MQSMSETLSRRGFGPGAGAPSNQAAATDWRQRVRAVVRGPWGRPLGRAGLALSAVVFLSWLGARSAESTTAPSGELDPKLGSLVTMAATPIRSAMAERTAPKDRKDAGPDGPSEAGAPRGILADGRIVLNVADAQELCQLPGVGPARAEKIIALRERLGRFRSVRQLLRVRGIGRRTLERLRPRVVLDAPSGDSDAG
jgi:competence protein ComEA